MQHAVGAIDQTAASFDGGDLAHAHRASSEDDHAFAVRLRGDDVRAASRAGAWPASRSRRRSSAVAIEHDVLRAPSPSQYALVFSCAKTSRRTCRRCRCDRPAKRLADRAAPDLGEISSPSRAGALGHIQCLVDTWRVRLRQKADVAFGFDAIAIAQRFSARLDKLAGVLRRRRSGGQDRRDHDAAGASRTISRRVGDDSAFVKPQTGYARATCAGRPRSQS